MKTPHCLTLLLLSAFSFSAFQLSEAATIASKTAKTTLAGTEKVPLDDSGTDKHVTVSNMWKAMILSGGFTASGSAAWDLSGSTGAFLTPTGAFTIGSSSVTLASSITPATNDVGALGSASLSFADLFLASGGVINFANGNWAATHTSGILTVGTGDLRVTTAGTNSASVVTVGGAQTLASKVITAATITTSLVPTTDDGAPLGDTTHHFSDLFLATGAVLNFQNGNVAVTHSSGILTMGTGELRITTAGTDAASVPTLGSTSTLTNKTLTSANVTTKLAPTTDDGAPLGDTTHHFSDLFLATGAVLNFQNGNVAVTHSSGILTMGTGELRITTPGTNSASVPTLGSTSTLTNKTLTAPVITDAVVTAHVTVSTGDDAISIASGTVLLEKTSAAACTLAAPSSQDGTEITFITNTDFAHAITFTGSTLLDGTTGANLTATFAAFKGASLTVVARGTTWLVKSSNLCTIAP